MGWFDFARWRFLQRCSTKTKIALESEGRSCFSFIGCVIRQFDLWGPGQQKRLRITAYTGVGWHVDSLN